MENKKCLKRPTSSKLFNPLKEPYQMDLMYSKSDPVSHRWSGQIFSSRSLSISVDPMVPVIYICIYIYIYLYVYIYIYVYMYIYIPIYPQKH